MKTSIQQYRPHNPLNLGVLKYKHRKMYSGEGARSQELNWDKACLAGFLSRVSIFRDENVPFLLVYRGHLSDSNRGGRQQISRNVCVLLEQLGLLVGRISGPRERIESKLSAKILPLTDWQNRQYQNGCRIWKLIETCKSELFKFAS